MADIFPILQSGFVGGTDSRLSKPDSEANLYTDYILLKTEAKVNNPYFFSKDITKLFNDWFGNKEIMRDFDFREKVLKEAMDAFGVGNNKSALASNFPHWLRLQEDKPTVSELHVKFLRDCAKFIECGKRDLSVWQWYPLIKADTTTLASRSKDTGYIAWTAAVGSQTNENLVRKWVSHLGGYEDLLTTLFIVFGERTAVTTMGYKHPG